jgi:transcriptional regulator with XRE-family HTH domain
MAVGCARLGAGIFDPEAGVVDESTDESTQSGPRLRQLGEYIRLRRQMADLSLRRMAEMTQVSNAYLSQVERGLHQPSIRVLRSIAGALNLSAEVLLVQAGLLDADVRDERPADGTSAVLDTESVIRQDPALRPEDREALVRIYRSLRREGEGRAPRGA